MSKKKHYTGKRGTRGSCGIQVPANAERVTTEKEFWQADQDGTLCKRCYRAATNESSPF